MPPQQGKNRPIAPKSVLPIVMIIIRLSTSWQSSKDDQCVNAPPNLTRLDNGRRGPSLHAKT